MKVMRDIADLMGRLFLGFIFLYEAYDSIAFFDITKGKMTEYDITWRQDFLLYGAIVLLVIGGILLVTGYRTGFGISLLLMYWIPVTFIVYSFWDAPESEYRLQSVMFMKNIAIMGGMLIMWANKSRRYSIKRIFATTKVPKIRW